MRRKELAMSVSIKALEEYGPLHLFIIAVNEKTDSLRNTEWDRERTPL